MNFAFTARLSLLFLFALPAIGGITPSSMAHYQDSESVDGEDLEEGESAPEESAEDVGAMVNDLRTSDENWPQMQACTACTGPLCSDHMSVEHEALAQVRKAWSKASDEDRLQSVFSLGHLSTQHSNLANPAVCDFLVEAMKDDEAWEVRAAAAYSLGHQPNPEDFLTSMQDHMLRFDESLPEQREIVRSYEELLDDSVEKALRLLGPQRNMRAGLSMLEQFLPVVKERTKLNRMEAEWGASVASIGRCIDPKASKSLLRQARHFKKNTLPRPLRLALLQNPTQARVQVIIGQFKALESGIKSYEKIIKKIRKSKMPRPPRTFKGTSRQWKVAFGLYVEIRVDVFVSMQDRLIGSQDVQHDLLVAWAENQSLQMSKLRKKDYVSSWKNFFANNKRHWPKVLQRASAGE
ncbi:MAG: HEAT repeat domain-containing protein [Planctomycetes bacterium]|nr:HEAT repeat domain-containing protein [Planctomycetota bacterium]